MLKKITEVGVAVRDLEETTNLFVHLIGGKASEVKEVPLFGMRYRMIKLANIDFEIMEPTDDNGTIGKFIRQKGEGLHHVAFAVDNLGEMLDYLKKQGCKTVNDQPLNLLGAKVAFLHPKSFFGVMIELIEYPKGWVFPDGEACK